MNKVCLSGRLTRDPEIRYTQGENSIAIANFSIAVNRKYTKGGEQSADFPNCKAFGKSAEFIEKYFRKGMKMDLTGRLQTGSYTNKDGNKVYTTDVIIEECEFGESKTSASANAESSKPNNNSGDDDFMNIPDGVEDGLPFN